jgi:hypothetical protein
VGAQLTLDGPPDAPRTRASMRCSSWPRPIRSAWSSRASPAAFARGWVYLAGGLFQSTGWPRRTRSAAGWVALGAARQRAHHHGRVPRAPSAHRHRPRLGRVRRPRRARRRFRSADPTSSPRSGTSARAARKCARGASSAARGS